MDKTLSPEYSSDHTADFASPQRVWINGRFLTRKVTGVERVAHEVLRALATDFLDSRGRTLPEQVCTGVPLLSFGWALPPDYTDALPSYGTHWPAQKIGRLRGHAWEQYSLARFAPNDWLLSLCNTAPLWRTRQAVFFHDAQVFALSQNFDWKFRLWYKALLHMAGRRAQVLLTNSRFSQQEIARYTGLKPKRLVVAHLGVDHMVRLAYPAQSPPQLSNTRPTLLAVSSASPNKNFMGAVRAVALLAQQSQAHSQTHPPTQPLHAAPHLLIVGQTYSKVFQSAALEAGQYTTLGYVSDEQLAQLYQSATCLVYPSYYEGFGLPPLEAMRLGCLVVASRTSSLPEVLGEWAFYCDPSDPASIAQAISQVLSLSPQARAQHIAKAKEYAAQFTWRKTAAVLLQALAQGQQVS